MDPSRPNRTSVPEFAQRLRPGQVAHTDAHLKKTPDRSQESEIVSGRLWSPFFVFYAAANLFDAQANSVACFYALDELFCFWIFWVSLSLANVTNIPGDKDHLNCNLKSLLPRYSLSVFSSLALLWWPNVNGTGEEAFRLTRLSGRLVELHI